VIRPKTVRLLLNLNTLICRLRGVRVKLLSYAKILLINSMLLAPILIRIRALAYQLFCQRQQLMVMLQSQELEFVTLNAFNEILRQSRPGERLSSRTFLLEVIRAGFL
jgi:hypothetical protein